MHWLIATDLDGTLLDDGYPVEAAAAALTGLDEDSAYQFCKGYYARVASGKLNGRVCRLLVSPLIRTAKACYYRIALDLIESYANDAAMNGLELDRHAEEQAVELFATNILKAGASYLEGGEEIPFLPSWHRVTSVYRHVHRDLLGAVAADREQHAPVQRALAN